MSMFHELMMRKKEQIMYATIKGTLTENDGVFSGFSASNYLQINQIIVWDNNAEIVCTFTMPSSALTNVMTNLFIGKYSSSARNGFTIYTTGGKSYIYANLNLAGVDTNTYINTVPLELGQKYTAKLIFNGSSYVLELWQNGVKLGEKTISSSSTMSTVSAFYVGSFENANFFTGSIDLNKSYIKIDNTKYNLQAVVGYTIVGSPTITDGVVSGFSASDYLQLPQISAGTVKSFEISTKFTTGAILTDSTIIGINLAYNYGINLYASGKYLKGRIKIGANYYEVDSAINTVKANTTYFVKFIVDTEIGKEYLKVSTDNINWQTTERDIATSVINNAIQWRIGTGSVGAFGGSIDLNNTDIKVNRKLWFNGQQA